MGEQALLIGGKAEIVALLLHPFHRRAGRGEMLAVRALGQLALVEEGFIPHRVPAWIFGDVDIALCRHAPPDFLAGGVVARLGGAHDVIGARIQRIAHLFELGGGTVGQLLGRDAVARGRLLHLLAMLVHAGDEQHIAPIEAHEALDGIGRDPLVGVADMRRTVGVGNGGGDVKTRGSGHLTSRLGQFGVRRSADRSASIQTRAARAAAARSAKMDRMSGRLSRFRASVSRTASATFSHTSA